MQLTDHQDQAVQTILGALEQKSEVSLSGPAGSGKTTLLKNLVPLLEDEYYDVVVVTPTNKAAKVLNDKGIQASTIHKLFFVPVPKSRPLRFDPCYLFPGGLPDGKRKDAAVTVIDEASMLSTWMIRELRKMSDRIVLVGDPHQLPPVNDRINLAGHFNSLTHTANLSEILRQAEGSDILGVATAIRTGKPYEALMRQFSPELTFKDTVESLPQFIAFTNKERARVNRAVRALFGRYGSFPEPGEKMICASNYSDILLNGTECTLLSFDWNGRSLLAKVLLQVDNYPEPVRADINMYNFLMDLPVSQREGYSDLMQVWKKFLDQADEGDEPLSLRYGYCITAHAAQGSEYRSVVVIDQTPALRYAAEQNDSRQMTPDQFVRRWMYTAITRAREELVVAQPWWIGNYASAEAA